MYISRIHGTWLLSCLFLSRLATTKTVNITIDDTDGDSLGNVVTYTPVNAWNSNESNCPECSAKPDGSFTYNQTWHESTFNAAASRNNYPNTVLTASTRFSGTAVYVHCVLPRTTAFPTGNSDMSFYLDGQYVGAFAKAAPGTAGYDYDTVVYTNTSLSAGFHTLVIQNGHINGNRSIVILDKIVYTHNTDDEKESTPIGAIVGPVVGGVVLIALGILAFVLCRRRQRRTADAPAIDAFVSEPKTQSVWISGRNQDSRNSNYNPYARTPTDSQYTCVGAIPMSPLPSPNHVQNQNSYGSGGSSGSGVSTRKISVSSPTGMSQVSSSTGMSTPMVPPASPPVSGVPEEAPPEYQEQPTSAVGPSSSSAATGSQPLSRVDQKRTRNR